MKKKSRQGRWLVIGLIVIGLIMGISVAHLRDYVQRSVHDERVAYLSTQVQTVATLINTIVDENVAYADICANVVSDTLNEGEDVFAFVDEMGACLQAENAELVVVDDACVWYGKNGTTGRVTEPTLYGSSSDRSEAYITTIAGENVESLVVRVRLENPVSVATADGTATAAFVAVAASMDVIHDEFMNAFPSHTNSFICDESGLMLYRNFGIRKLMEGSNVIRKMERCDFRYDTTESLMTRLENDETIVGEFPVDGENYFFCASPLEINGWFAAFVFSAEDLSSGSYIPRLSFYMALLGFLFTLALVLTVLTAIRGHENRRNLELEKEANVLLGRASQAKTDFLSNMSHDIRTPINGIMGMTTLARTEKDDTKRGEYLRKIQVSAGYLLSLVNDVLDMSKIESGKLTITTAASDLPEFLEDCATVAQGLVQERDLKIITDFSGIRHGRVVADEVHMRQIMINILSNAVKFTPDGGSITFTATEEEQSEGGSLYRFVIRDTGIGMDEEFLKTIWDRFSQAEQGARGTYRGTGLGMAICKGLVGAMDGDIRVESVVNEGSTFTVELPLSYAVEEKKAEITGLHILLVEDNDINLEIAAELLTSEGAMVETAEDGQIALDKFTASEPGYFDAILMDIMMPVMDGLEAARRIRASDRPDAASVPIVAMTASVLQQDIENTSKAGMNAHLTKPMDINAVVRVLSELCGGV